MWTLSHSVSTPPKTMDKHLLAIEHRLNVDLALHLWTKLIDSQEGGGASEPECCTFVWQN